MKFQPTEEFVAYYNSDDDYYYPALRFAVFFCMQPNLIEAQTFIPLSLEFDAMRCGTSKGEIYVRATSDDWNTNVLLLEEQRPEDGGSHYYVNISGIEIKQMEQLKIGIEIWDIATNKQMAIGNVKIQGYVKTPAITREISTAGYATFCSPYHLDFSEVEGLKAYVAKAVEGEEGTVTFEQVSDVPAQTGVLLKGDAGTYTIPATWSTNNVDDNLFVGVLNQEVQPAGIYVLMNGSSGVGFYRTTQSFTLGAGTAYLPALPEDDSADTRFIGVGNDDAAGITELKAVHTNANVYTLSGLKTAQPSKGIYIINGKKIVK